MNQLIPAITYNSERIQIYGPNIQIGLIGSGKLRLAAIGKYRISVYEEDESDFLEGMVDRKDTFMAGLTRDWLVMVNASVELLEGQVTDSPIVQKDYVVKGFAAINYVF